MSAYQTLSIDREGPLAVVTIRREQALNALSSAVMAELTAAAAELDRDAGVRVVALTGAGKAFVAGADIAEMQDLSRQAPGLRRGRRPAGRRPRGLPKGGSRVKLRAGSGCELAIACDHLRLREGQQPARGQARRHPGFGGPSAGLAGSAWPRPKSCASPATGGDALRIGLADLVVAPEALMPTVRELAGRIAANGPLAVAPAKRCIHRGQSMPLADALALEQREFGALFATADQKEGMTAFVGKRAAQFTGS
jgi:enoyl-CoA hydratase